MSEKNPGRLFLLPAPLRQFEESGWSAATVSMELPALALQLFSSLPVFIVESEKSALRLLSRFRTREAMESLILKVFDEHSKKADIPELLDVLARGIDVGILSESGLPCIADPGAMVVAEAHVRGFRIVPVSGPSSILLALASSGFQGQRFNFLGYLPAERASRQKTLLGLGSECPKDRVTRIFIETPYRNDAVFADCLKYLPETLWLSVASNLLGEHERITTRPLKSWNAAEHFSIGKTPTVFLLGFPATDERYGRQ